MMNNKSNRLFNRLFWFYNFLSYAMRDIRIGSLNLNGAGGNGKIASVFKLCSIKQLDAFFGTRDTQRS